MSSTVSLPSEMMPTPGNGLGRDGVIAGDHDDLRALCATVQPHHWPLEPWLYLPLAPAHTLMPALRHLPTVGDSCSGRVDHGHEPTKQRLSVVKFTSSQSTAKPLGNCSSGR